jgi:hypothetical protein
MRPEGLIDFAPPCQRHDPASGRARNGDSRTDSQEETILRVLDAQQARVEQKRDPHPPATAAQGRRDDRERGRHPFHLIGDQEERGLKT